MRALLLCLSNWSFVTISKPYWLAVSGDGLEDAEGRALRVSQKGKAADGRLAFEGRNVGWRHMDGSPQRLGLLHGGIHIVDSEVYAPVPRELTHVRRNLHDAGNLGLAYPQHGVPHS